MHLMHQNAEVSYKVSHVMNCMNFSQVLRKSTNPDNLKESSKRSIERRRSNFEVFIICILVVISIMYVH